jgi:hypothetical protein
MRCFILLITACTFLVGGCNKGETPEYNDRPVVEAYLASGYTPVVKITRQGSVSSSVAYGNDSIPLLAVFLDVDGTSHQLVFRDSVFTDSALTVEAGKTYRLHFIYNEKETTATTTIPSLPQGFGQSVTSISLDKIDSNTVFTPGGFSIPDPVKLGWINADKSYYMTVATNLETNRELVRDTSDVKITAPSFRNTPSVTDSTDLMPMQFEYFGKYRLVLYHLNEEYAMLYISSGNSSTDLTSPSTNISNGFGIFTGISTDTLFLQVYKK